jgi:8-oxo-dGTP pyrophosphatase MutT (NUDIX family)
MASEPPGVTEAIRAAATAILWRDKGTGPELLMGQRGAAAVFMPSKYVFPGGAVDPADHHGVATNFLTDLCLRRLAVDSGLTADTLVEAARRELAEETGLTLQPQGQAGAAMRFVFRAITPPGRTRRFDARFFLVDGGAIMGDPDDFSRASGELSRLGWIGLDDARGLDLPFITEVVLAEVEALLSGKDQPGVPFFDNSTDIPTFRRIV